MESNLNNHRYSRHLSAIRHPLAPYRWLRQWRSPNRC